ncbi:MAG: C-GCAxxG-C-C family protein [Chloroflexota bacterium]|nr:C-GCAxxG-C-C family protein [Chloroflexota bacterium]
MTDFAKAFEEKSRRLPASEASREMVAELTYDNFMSSFGCSQSVLQAFQDILGFEDRFWFKTVGALQGGGFSGLICGALATGLLLIGGRVGRDSLEQGIHGMLPAFEPCQREPCQRLTTWFRPMYKSTICSEIAGVDWFNMSEVADRFLGPEASEAHEKCARLASGTAHKIAEILSEL